MPIDKRIPRVLNSDADSKALDKVSMEDALNLYSGPDNEGFLAGVKSDAGNNILKNIRGNSKVVGSDSLPTNARLIGSVEDTRLDVTYLFIYAPQAANQGVWVYDRYGKLPGSAPNSIKLVYKSNQFNFPQNGFVKADIVYSNAIATFAEYGPEFDKDTIIYFTDGENEPRKINAYRALDTGGQNMYPPSNVYAEADFITACPKVPLKPITFSFENDPSRSTSNFSATPGFQFAYQYVYKDGMESAISPYSDVAFPPSVVFQGAQPYSDHSTYNTCKLEIPLPGDNVTESNEIQAIKILAKQGKLGSFLIIDELSIVAPLDLIPGNINADENTYSYKFYNDKIGTAVSQDEVNKQFDAVPRKATAQSVSSNRLMYGNYLDGFNSVKTQAKIEAVYKEAPESFLSYDVGINPSIEPIGTAGGQNQGKSVGFVLDFSGMPSELPEGTELSLSFTIAPDRNWHVYSYKNNAIGTNPESYHQTRQLGIQTQSGIDNGYDGVNYQQSIAETDAEAGAGFFSAAVYLAPKYFGNGNGVCPSNQSWQMSDSTLDGAAIANIQNISYGTSAANPLILKGGAVSFSAKIKSTQDITQNTQQRINNAFRKAFFNQDVSSEGFEVVGNVYSSDSYSLDVGLYSGKRIKQDQIRAGISSTDPEAKLIVGVKTFTYGYDYAVPPGGYFIVNKANVGISLREVDNAHYDFVPITSSHFRLRLDSVSNPEIYTCIHDTTDDDEELASTDWIAVSRSDMESVITSSGIESWLASKGISPALKFHLAPSNITASEVAAGTIARQIGYLRSPNVFNIGEEYSLMDGEGGPGGGPSYAFGSSENSYDDWKLYNQGSVTVNPSFSDGVYSYGSTVFYTGEIGGFQATGTTIQNTPRATILPMLFRLPNDSSGAPVYSYILPAPDPSNSDIITAKRPNFKRLQSPAEIVSKGFTISNFDQLNDRSFKTEANHDFGIVYYDERGRHGFVNPLGTEFVEGYTDAERPGGGGKGRVEIKITLQHAPPSWAYYYKIVYSKNTTVSDFVQYTAGGGYVSQNLEDQEIAESNQNIYVSLNYLQGHHISYVSSFGARTPEAGLNLYKFQEGDKLRVISYFEGEDRIYRDYEFDIVDLVKIGEIDNPLLSEAEDVPSYLKGDFVVLKNNPSAFGFTHGEVLAGTDKWGDNCIIELRTPLKDVDADQLVFYEMSDTYDVVKDASNNLVHDQEVLYLTNGDVWFRPVATNVREYENGEYVDLIFDADSADPPPKPNFKNVFLETSTATDLFRGDNLGLGRPNFVLKNAKETVREATITYSDPSNPEGKRLNYSSFNASLFNFKDLPERFGGIQYLSDQDEYLFVLQEDKVSIVPVNKNILSDASGSDMVIASREVLGRAVFYPGQNGVATDPSSVFDSSQEAYFCNRTVSQVYRWTKQSGVEEISDKGMSSVIRASIIRALDGGGQVRIVGGYDPLKDEYLFTIAKPEILSTTGAVAVLPHPNKLLDPDVDPTGDDGGVEEFSPYISVGEPPVFPELTAGDPAQERPITIYNEGNADLEIQGVSFTGNVFSVRNFVPFFISPDGSQNINILFTPSTAGVFNETMTITSSDPNNSLVDISLSASAVEAEVPEETENSPFTNAYNELFNTTLTDEDMSAELAVDYLLELENSSEEEQPTLGLMIQLFNAFPPPTLGVVASNSLTGDTNGDGVVTIPELLAFLEGFEPNDYDLNSSAYSPATIPDEGDDDAAGSGNENLFSSPQEAINLLLDRGDMTAAEFNMLKFQTIPYLKCDLNEDLWVGTADLLDFLAGFGKTYSPSEPAFETSPAVGAQNIESNITSLECIQYLISNRQITIAQYHQISQYVRNEIKADIVNAGVSENNVNTSDLLYFLSGYQPTEGGSTSFDPNALALY